MVLLAALQITVSAQAADTLDFTGRLGPIAPENILQEPGYYIWCGSAIRGEDGKYTDTKGIKHSLTNLERPQLLFDDQGKPIVLFCAAGEKDPFKGTPSFNLAIPILE